MTRRIIAASLVLFLTFIFIKPVSAKKNKVTIHFFWAKGCPHCRHEKVFLKTLAGEYPQIEIKDYEITESKENAQLLLKVGKELKADVSGIPFTVIGRDYIVGFYSDEVTGEEIRKKIDYALKERYEDLVGNLREEELVEKTEKETRTVPESLKVPLLGEIKIKNLSLPAFTFVIAFLDGFNPCAMWVLLFLISLLLGMKDRLKMYVLGSVFIFSSGFVYFLFLSTWLNFFLFIGFVFWVRVIIGLVALFSGGYNLREYYLNKEAVCKVTKGEKRQKIFKKLRKITQRKEFLLSVLGIITLAFAVNLVELVCSAGLPAVYSQVLTLTNLPQWQYYLYLIFYIIIFMLDDLIVFLVAMYTLKTIGIESKYSRFSHLVGGVIMLIIGILILFKPELLMFG